ncbi:MAG TPA: 7-carboxy-7-deazaguanine synthase QueE [Clostridia bacterium]|nr:7-carboxy-7-deazaguanine synthase QueE [Clostridia bacterium]
MSDLPVYEIFGPTIQGEGMFAGQRTIFLRLAGCDYRCAWCDTVYARDVRQARQHLPEEDIVALVKDLNRGTTNRITITGGNPCMHDLNKLVKLLHRENYTIHIETQGSIIPEWLFVTDHVCLSPKPPSSGNTTDISVLDPFMRGHTPRELKIVVGDEGDYLYAKQIHQEYRSCPFTLQPLTDGDPLPIFKWLAGKVSSDPGFGDNVRILPQLHVLAGIK